MEIKEQTKYLTRNIVKGGVKMSKFKVGDKVKYLGTLSYNFEGNLGKCRKGDTFTISAVGEGTNPSYNVIGSYVDNSKPNWCNMEKNFELVKANKFKSGDTVKCKDNAQNTSSAMHRYGGSGWNPGKVFTIGDITEKDEDHSTIYFPVDGSSGVFEPFLELVEGPKEVKLINKQMELKVGDKVTIRGDLRQQLYGEMIAVSEMIRYSGKIATITQVHKIYNKIDLCDWNWSDEMFDSNTIIIPTNKKMDIEELKKVDTKILKLASEEVLEERAEKQKNEAKVILGGLLDRKEEAEKRMAEINAEIKDISKGITLFNKKK